MSNKTTKTEQSLTMLTASETQLLSRAAEAQDQISPELIYKYRDQFLHIQSAAGQGLKQLKLLVDDTTEFERITRAWGYTPTVKDEYKETTITGKGQSIQTTQELTSNVTVDWSRPNKPTVDVEVYRESGNLVKTETSKLNTSSLAKLKKLLGVNDQNYEVVKTLADNLAQGRIEKSTKTGVGAEILILVQPNSKYGIWSIDNPGKGYTVGDTISVAAYQLGQPDLTRYNAVITVEGVAEQRLVNPSQQLRGRVKSSVYIIEPGGITSCSITGTAGPSVVSNEQVRFKDSTIVGFTSNELGEQQG